MSTTVAANSGSDAITVRSGPLAVAAGSLTAKPTLGTAAFTWEVPFSQPFPYRSGTLDMLINNQPIAVIDGRLDAIDADNVALQSVIREKFAIAINSATVSSPGHVPVARYSADAQVMVPNALKDESAFGAASAVSPYDSTERTYQQILGASELTYVPIGSLITSISYANFISTPWPDAAGASADDYSIEISTAARRPDTMSVTFAENVGNDALIVRSGPIAWLPGVLPSVSTGRFGGTITFDRGFVYKGGDLCITIRHSGVTTPGTVRTVAPGPSSRSTYNEGNKVAATGLFFGGNSSAAVQLGYIPSGVSPKNVLAADGNGGRFLLAGVRSYQMIYDADQVGVPVGATINGVSFRLENYVTGAFPATDLTLDRFDITMSSATRSAATMSNTFAANEGADVTTVRSGAITIAAASFPPNAHGGRRFGIFIPFTRPFVYKGGPITMLLRNGNASGAGTDVEFDAHSVGANGKRDTSSADAVSGVSVLNAVVARFAFTEDAFCPADLNNDGLVDDADFQIFLLAYNTLDCSDPAMDFGCPSDFTHDTIVNDDDFLPFVQAYNALLCP